MATMRQWEDSAATLTNDELDKITAALDTLRQWETFEEAFTPDMREIRFIVSHENSRRLIDSLKTKGYLNPSQ